MIKNIFFLFLLFWNVYADTINDQIYDTLSLAHYCVKLLHVNGWIGCQTPAGGLNGILRYPGSDANSLAKFLNSPPSEAISLVIPINLFNKLNMDLIRSKCNLAGVMILYTAGGPGGVGNSGTSGASGIPPFNSPEVPNPQAPTFNNMPYFNIDSPFYQNNPINQFQWNPSGDGLSMDQFDFGVVYLTASESDLILFYANQNENNVAKNYHPPHSANFNFRMFANKNSVQCLSDSTCFPVGSQSVWWYLGAPLNSSAPIVMASSIIDTSSFFHGVAPGADADGSGWVAMMAAHHALTHSISSSIIAALPSTIVFATFNGESWARVGSRKFVEDVSNFTCNVPGPTSNSCSQPYKPDLSFQQLSLNRIRRLIELNQIALNSTLHLHHDLSANPDQVNKFISTVFAVANNMTRSGNPLLPLPANVALPSSSLPGLPPSSSMAFIQKNTSIPALVLTDHYSTYANPYYHSMFDLHSSITNQDPSLSRLCSAATLTARIIFLEAGGDLTLLSSINADCTLVTSLFNCLTTDWSCPLFSQYVPFNPIKNGNVPSRYSSIYQLAQLKYLGGLPLLINLMASDWSRNFTAPVNPSTGLVDPTSPLPSNVVFFHDAVDPVLTFNYKNGMWNPPAFNQSYIWTESNWDNGVGVTLYQTENPTTELAMLISGIGLFILSFIFIHFAKLYCSKHFKPL